MSSSAPQIAIIGAGPAGLTVGLLLHRHGIPFTIFELRQKPTDEELAKPSGMLDLHEESGIAAIKECGLFDEFLTFTGECTEAQKVCDKHGHILYSDEGETSQRPEISRHALTGLLLSHIPADRIQWGHKLLAATVSTQQHVEITLEFGIADGGGDSSTRLTQTFDLVVGADGAWSKVRNTLLTDTKPQYAGTQCMTLTVRDITTKYPHLSELVGQGSFAALGNRHGIVSQRGPRDSARFYVILTSEDEHFAATDTAGVQGQKTQTATAVKEHVLNDTSLLGTWSPTLKELVAAGTCDEEEADAVDLRPLYILPVGHAWDHVPGATIIGDAAHLMGPWAGEGVNLAMWDALLLSRAIARAYDTTAASSPFQSNLDPLLRDFEADMVVRATEKAEESFANGQMMFGEDGAKAFANFFLEFAGPPPPPPAASAE